MTARSSLTLCSRLGPISEPSKDNSLSENTLFDCAEVHAIDALIVWLPFSKSRVDLIIGEGKGATV